MFWADDRGEVAQLAGTDRKLRVEYPGATYHVINRGDRREPIFKDDLDCRRFLETLGEACAKSAWQVQAYCLMENHFQMEPKFGRHHGGPERRATAAAGAERMLAEELKRRGRAPDQLAGRRKGDREKVRIARRLRKETTMTLDWIAQRLKMGAAGCAAQCLHQAR